MAKEPKADQVVGEDDGEAADDDDSGAHADALKTLLHVFPLKSASTKSQCGICAYLNPAIDGIIVRRQSVRLLNKDGEATGKWLRGEVRIAAVTPKSCAPDKNDHCPARETRLVVGANIDNLVARMIKAERAKNFTGVAEIAATVSELDEALQTQFSTKLEAARVQPPPDAVQEAPTAGGTSHVSTG